MGRNKYGVSGPLHIFAFLKHLMGLLRLFSGLYFLHLVKTLIDMQLRYFKVKTMLNNAFKFFNWTQLAV